MWFSEYVFEINILLQIPHPRLGPAHQLTVGTIFSIVHKRSNLATFLWAIFRQNTLKIDRF